MCLICTQKITGLNPVSQPSWMTVIYFGRATFRESWDVIVMQPLTASFIIISGLLHTVILSSYCALIYEINARINP